MLVGGDEICKIQDVFGEASNRLWTMRYTPIHNMWQWKPMCKVKRDREGDFGIRKVYDYVEKGVVVGSIQYTLGKKQASKEKIDTLPRTAMEYSSGEATVPNGADSLSVCMVRW